MALSRIPSDYRQVVEWRNRDSLRFPEIRRRLGRSENAARMLWQRALANLRKELERS